LEKGEKGKKKNGFFRPILLRYVGGKKGKRALLRDEENEFQT